MQEKIKEELIVKVAAIAGVDPKEINGSTDMKNVLKISSLELTKIITEFEEEYDAYIKYTELMHAKTIDEVSTAIAKYIK